MEMWLKFWLNERAQLLCTKKFLSILSFEDEVSFAKLFMPLKNAGLPI